MFYCFIGVSDNRIMICGDNHFHFFLYTSSNCSSTSWQNKWWGQGGIAFSGYTLYIFFCPSYNSYSFTTRRITNFHLFNKKIENFATLLTETSPSSVFNLLPLLLRGMAFTGVVSSSAVYLLLDDPGSLEPLILFFPAPGNTHLLIHWRNSLHPFCFFY